MALRTSPPVPPPDFWEHPPIREAAADRHMGRLIAAYRSHPAHGISISQETVGRWALKSQSQICRIETGRPEQHLDQLQFWARLLDIPQRLLWFLMPENNRPAHHEYDGTSPRNGAQVVAVSSAVVSPTAGVIDQETVRAGVSLAGITYPGGASAVTETWLTHLNNLADLAGGIGWAALHRLADRQMRSLEAFRQRQPEFDLTLADARWSEFMSWICANGGFPGAEAWLERALHRAAEARDPVVKAYVYMRRSQHAVDGSDASTAVSLSRYALDGYADIPPKTKALCLTRLAEGLALAGSDESLDILTTAHALASQDSDEPADEMARHCDSRYVNAARARCLYLLGERHEARTRLEEVLSQDGPASAIDVGMWTAYLAENHAVDQPDDGAIIGQHALDIADSTESARIVKALSPVAVAIRPHRGSAAVNAFLTRYRASTTIEVPISTPWT